MRNTKPSFEQATPTFLFKKQGSIGEKNLKRKNETLLDIRHLKNKIPYIFKYYEKQKST